MVSFQLILPVPHIQADVLFLFPVPQMFSSAPRPPPLSDLSPAPVPELRQRDAQSQLGCHIGQWIARGLTGQGGAAGEPGIHLDDVILQRERTESDQVTGRNGLPGRGRRKAGKKKLYPPTRDPPLPKIIPASTPGHGAENSSHGTSRCPGQRLRQEVLQLEFSAPGPEVAPAQIQGSGHTARCTRRRFRGAESP